MAARVGALTWHGTPSRFASSTWAERGFCRGCGSSLFFRITAPGRYAGNTFVLLGAFDDPTGLTLTSEMFSDQRPSAYAFAGELASMTAAEAHALLAAGLT